MIIIILIMVIMLIITIINIIIIMIINYLHSSRDFHIVGKFCFVTDEAFIASYP